MKRIAFCGVLLSAALAVSYIETLIPPFLPSIPGIKLGLANIVTLYLLYCRSAKIAFVVGVLRVILAGLMFSGLWTMLYSLSGMLVSFAAMVLLKKASKFSVIGVSIAGGVAHNMAQLAVAVLTLGNVGLFYYYPMLIIFGMLCGALIGVIVNRLRFKNTEGR